VTDRPSTHGARVRIPSLTRSFEERDAGLRGGNPIGFDGYEVQLQHARAQTDVSEACIWGIAHVGGERCALVVFDFGFLGGSMGVVVGEKVARAFDTARRERLPVVTVTSSGGARMQEGMWALVQMAKTVEAHRRHAAAGLAHVTVLASPTTGGVYASFASLADVIVAEDDATVGFAGPRVVEELTGSAPASDVNTASFAFAHGLVDALVTPDDVAAVVARALAALRPERTAVARGGEASAEDAAGAREMGAGGARGVSPRAWERLQRVREPGWPKAPQVLDVLVPDPVVLRGDRTGATDDASVVVRAGGLAGTKRNVVAIGLDASGDGRVRPEGFRKAVRALRIAGRLGIPVVTVVDTRGADPLPSSEGAGIAAAIARTFEAMLDCPAPTLSVVTGEGGSGGGLALAVADRVLAWESAVFSVIAPEAAAAILYRDPSRGPELAERLGITAADLVRLGLVDRVIPEPPGGVGAHPQAAMEQLASGVASEIEGLVVLAPRRRLRQREKRWRNIARPTARGSKGRGRSR
jgi:acetyl-CoA carboxylase carboxyl transferase beta subunit